MFMPPQQPSFLNFREFFMKQNKFIDSNQATCMDVISTKAIHSSLENKWEKIEVIQKSGLRKI